MTQMKVSPQAKVGMVTVLALLLLAGLIVWKGDFFLKARGYAIIGVFQNVGGLSEGADVRYRGFKVGKVVSVNPSMNENLVTVSVGSQVTVPADSSLRIAFDGLIGQKYLEIVPGSSEARLAPGSRVTGFSTLGLVDFVDVGTKNLQESKRILTSFRELSEDPNVKKAIKGSLINVEGASHDISAMTKRFTLLADELQQVTASLKTLFGPEETKDLKESIHNMSRVARTLGTLTDDPSFIRDLKSLIANAKDAAGEMRDAAKRANRALERFSRQ